MFTRCLVCRAPFPENHILAGMPHGNRVAYDLEQGRLWVVCRSCRRWSLVPLEARWETLEELAALTSGPAGLRIQTNQIALFRHGPLEVVRVGRAEPDEEAWWRYGKQLLPRSQRDRWIPPAFRRIRFGDVAWRGEKNCSECGFTFLDIPFADRAILHVRPEAGFESPAPSGSRGSFSVTRRCPRCRNPEEGGLRLEGIEAELTLVRLLAFQSWTGESRVTVTSAARLMQDPEDAAGLVRLLSRQGKPLGQLQPIGLTALEMMVNAARERTLLRLEAEALQARWREEEALAALVDGELSPVVALDRLVRRVRGMD